MNSNILTSTSSAQEFSVSEISGKIKSLLESNFGFVQIRGEISGLKIATSGHGYFSLKDDKAVLAAICWRNVLSRTDFKLEDGLEVVISGKITAYAGQSKYQISVEAIRPSGVGAFMKILNERKTKLQKEGLFLEQHKKKIPFLPTKIGIITSMSGAVIKDIIHRIDDRCKTNLVIWPVSVQGPTSAEEVVSAIQGFNDLSANQKPELLIIARGGGSIEDLWSFNEEEVVRAAFKSDIPIISAIGHETDYTLLDLVADLRAPTPTAAAEFAVPVIHDLSHTLNNLENTLTKRLQDLIKYYQQKIITSDSGILNHTQSLIRLYTQKIDEIGFRFTDSLPNLLKHKQMALNEFSISRFQIKKTLQYKYLQYKNLSNIFSRQQDKICMIHENNLQILSSTLSSLDYKKVLQRGYAMVTDTNNKAISDSKNLPKTDEFYLNMRDGKSKIRVV